MPFIPRAVVPSVIQTTVNAEVSLASSPAAGATSFTVDTVPDGLKTGSVIAIDAFTTQCEIRHVVSVSGTTITVSRLMFAHASGDPMVFITDQICPVIYYGLTGDGSDEWQALQRLTLEARPYGLTVKGTAATFYFGQPLLIDTGSRIDRLDLRTRAGFAPVQAPGVGAAIMVGNGSFFFKATGSDDTFTSTASDYTTPVAHGLGPNVTIVFNNPYGEALPGNLVSGNVYYVKDTPTGSTFTISDTLGGSTLNISSDGTGWSINNPGDGLTRIFWESLYLIVSVVDLNGIMVACQQPSWTRNLRIDMTATASTQGSAVGFYLTGQCSYHDNVEANSWNNCTAVVVGGSGHIIKGFNSVGRNSDDVGIVFGGDSCGIHGIWTESHGRAGVELHDTMRGLLLEGPWLHAPGSLSTPALLVTGSQTSYEVGIVRTNNSGNLLVNDTSRGFSITAADGTEGGFVFAGMRQIFGSHGPQLKEQATGAPGDSDLTILRIHRYAIIVPTVNRTVTLPTAVGWFGVPYTIKNAGASNVIVATTSSQTVDGTTPPTLTTGQSITVLSNGANWVSIGH